MTASVDQASGGAREGRSETKAACGAKTLSGTCSVGTVAWSENKSRGTRRAQSIPGATGRIAARITAARKNQTISLRKEYIVGINHTPGSDQNLDDVTDNFG
jgi:hypothetical protein